MVSWLPRIRIIEPAFDVFYSQDPSRLTLQAGMLGSFKLTAPNVARQRALVRRLYM
jgi:hypothetical protein